MSGQFMNSPAIYTKRILKFPFPCSMSKTPSEKKPGKGLTFIASNNTIQTATPATKWLLRSRGWTPSGFGRLGEICEFYKCWTPPVFEKESWLQSGSIACKWKFRRAFSISRGCELPFKSRGFNPDWWPSDAKVNGNATIRGCLSIHFLMNFSQALLPFALF
jgi:hypothetical protein